ncbi:MAG TPA: DUF5131 family protein [Bryobacteraceae bacterium]|nr:DUF5131 family protein [Bryobacteraceae bacterium]
MKPVPALKFLSLEPLLGLLPSLNLSGIDWVIGGGESEPGARPMEECWVLDIKALCRVSAAPFFFKQWGGVNEKAAGRLLRGRSYDEMPTARRERMSNTELFTIA